MYGRSAIVAAHERPHTDPMGIYVAHICFWLVFAAANVYARRRYPATATPDIAATSASREGEPLRAKNASLLVAVHAFAFAVLFYGVGRAVWNRNVPFEPPTWRVVVGVAIIAIGAVLAFWARVSFASWRVRAQLDAGHQLATGGPFAMIRNPIYQAMNLLALGTAVWVNNTGAWLGVLLMAIGGALRARAEEPLLERMFGEQYREYRSRTWRFVPGIY
jgi:protein-S-isoprenylcysteine O-methyltransferase Ste14